MSDFFRFGNIFKASNLCAAEPYILHGFSCRDGGVSASEYTKSMNLGFLRGDTDDTVRENLRLFCAEVGFSSENVVLASQTHSYNVVYADESMKYRGKIDMSVFGFDGVDGFVTDKPNVALMIRIADCIPVLLADSEAGVIGACHAGWRGTMKKIAAVTVGKMVSLGAEPSRIQAAIGAGISPCCYTVGGDFITAFEENAPELLEFITDSRADLKEMNRAVLLRAGLSDGNININPACTCCRPDLYFSHRATNGKRGTMAAVIVKMP